MISDILFTVAAFGFTYSTIPQIRKLYRHKKTHGISQTRNKIIWSMIVITIAACVIENLLFSTIMNCIQLGFMTIVLAQVHHYRKEESA